MPCLAWNRQTAKNWVNSFDKKKKIGSSTVKALGRPEGGRRSVYSRKQSHAGAASWRQSRLSQRKTGREAGPDSNSWISVWLSQPVTHATSETKYNLLIKIETSTEFFKLQKWGFIQILVALYIPSNQLHFRLWFILRINLWIWKEIQSAWKYISCWEKCLFLS